MTKEAEVNRYHRRSIRLKEYDFSQAGAYRTAAQGRSVEACGDVGAAGRAPIPMVAGSVIDNPI
jgi:hypothetical protein